MAAGNAAQREAWNRRDQALCIQRSYDGPGPAQRRAQRQAWIEQRDRLGRVALEACQALPAAARPAGFDQSITALRSSVGY